MKTTLAIVAGALTILAMSLGFYQSYLLYKHIQATDVMWLLWVIQIPLGISLQIIAKALTSKD